MRRKHRIIGLNYDGNIFSGSDSNDNSDEVEGHKEEVQCGPDNKGSGGTPESTQTAFLLGSRRPTT